MRATARIQPNGQVAIPNRVREQAGLANDGYTPEQRGVIDARLAKSEADFKAGRTYGPFNTADDAVAFLRQSIKSKVAQRKRKPR